MFKLVYNGENDNKVFRDEFTKTLDKMMSDDKRICYLDADLMAAFGTKGLESKYPKRAIDCGIQEANMVGVAAGLASEGLIPYCHTFGVFASRRCYDQMFMSGAYAKNDLRIIGSDPGIEARYNGGTHMPFEDVALYRAVPNATIFDAVDATQLEWITKVVKDNKGISYIRSGRKGGKKVYADESTFEIGKAAVLKEGADVTIIAEGLMVIEALEAYELLKKEGINATIIDVVTIKPLDEEIVNKYARQTGAVVTAENASVMGGLYSAVSETIVANCPVPVEYVGVYERFGEVGDFDYLKQSFKLTAEEIVLKAKKAIERK